MNFSEPIWQFKTANFRIILDVAREETSPADTFDPTCHDINQICRDINSGRYAWFMARMRVVHLGTGITLGTDYLGACLYDSAKDFCTGANRNCYFRDMVRETIRDARGTVNTIAQVYTHP